MKRLVAQAKAKLTGIAKFGFPDPKGKESGTFFRLEGGSFPTTFDGAATEQIGLYFVSRDTDLDALVTKAEAIRAALAGRYTITQFVIGNRAPGGVYFELIIDGLYG